MSSSKITTSGTAERRTYLLSRLGVGIGLGLSLGLGLIAAGGAAGACGGGAATGADEPEATAPRLAIDAYHASDSVNSYVLSDGTGTLIIDATRSSDDARKVAALARARGGAPAQVLVTHGHPDHYLGLGALKQEFPALQIVVATPEIKADIIGMTAWLDAAGWLEKEPGMKPRSAANPAGFDYEAAIEVLAEPRLTTPGGIVLSVESDYPASEAAHMSTVYAGTANAFFSADLAYNDVHLWLGIGVSPEDAATWQRLLGELDATYGPRGTTIYPGHGAPTDAGVFARDRAYIDDLLRVVAETGSEAEAVARMIELYPTHASRDFLLTMSVQNQREQLRARGHE